jgi:predicted transcriptional regulator
MQETTQTKTQREQIANILEAYVKRNTPVKRSDLNTTFASVKDILDEVLARLPSDSVDEDVPAAP